jgi:peroxiredoxin
MAYGEFQQRGTALVTVSMDDVHHAKRMSDHAGAEFPVLADPQGTVVRRYGVYNLLNDGVAAPATLIVQNGIIQWRHVGENIADRPSTQDILDRLAQ